MDPATEPRCSKDQGKWIAAGPLETQHSVHTSSITGGSSRRKANKITGSARSLLRTLPRGPGIPDEGRGAPDARRILVSKAAKTRGRGARCALLPLFLLSLRRPRFGSAPPARTMLPLARSVSLDSGEYRRVARRGRALGESPARMATLSLAKNVSLGSGDDQGSHTVSDNHLHS